MTDNSSLVPSQSSPNFAQQGQFDWVAVARTPVAFTLDVLARYGKAGVDALTVGIARAVCSQFDLKPAAQKRLEESVSKIKTVPSFGKIAWFGFGLKHIIDDLLETEQGAACVALSGCLTTCYDTEYASQVFRSICQIKGAPTSLTPSLRQWITLVHVCAGSLTSSQFPHLLTGFERLLATHLQDRCCRTPPESETLARAIIILGSLSKGDLRGATFSGGLDCAWIAAMAEWILCLGVEINDGSGHTLYRSKSLSSSEIAHVIINIDGPLSNEYSALTHKTFFIPSGEDILRRTPAINELFDLRSAVRRPVPWTDILAATFGEETLLLLLHVPRNAFAAIIFSMLSLINPNELKYDTARTIFCVPIGSQRDIELLEWIIWRLPELRPCIEGSILPSRQSADWELCWELVGEACGCHRCSKTPPMIHTLTPEKEFCLKILALTIMDYLLLLFRLSIDPLVLPSCNGLRLLYYRKARDVRHTLQELRYESLLTYVQQEFELSEILEFLTGQSLSKEKSPQPSSALSANGICIFFDIFSDLDASPLKINTIQAIPGYIEYEGSQCGAVIDIVGPRHNLRLSSVHYDDKSFSYHMVVRQKVDETDIHVGYQMCVAGGGVELEGLYSILSNAMQRITRFDCTTWCQQGRDGIDKRLPGQKATIFDKTSINDQWVAVVLTRTDKEPFVYTLEAIRCRYPRVYLDILWDRLGSRACLVRINNCSKCLLMYALETLFFSFRADRETMWKAKGAVTIRRWGAEDVRIMLQEQNPSNRTWNELGAVLLFPNVPLDHDPIH